MEGDKRRKCADEYNNYSREELIEKIRDLEYRIQLKTKNEKIHFENEKSKRKVDFSKNRHIALKLLYLGWNYNGFVVQLGDENTVEDHLFRALIKGCLIENREGSNYHRCGRTDKGVSSFSQVISITVRSCITAECSDEDELPYCKILNGLLPNDIQVIAWSPVRPNFSARFNCKRRTYKYWFPRGNLDIGLMNESGKKLKGCHDFRNLCKMDVANGVLHFRREILDVDVTLFSRNSVLDSNHDVCHLIIAARGFLWHQIRCIISILFLIGQRKENPELIEELLNVEKHPRKPQYSLSSPLPLNLYSCEYEDLEWQIDQVAMANVIKSLHSHWTSEKIKSCMLENMLKDCYKIANDEYLDNIGSNLMHDWNTKNYKCLFSRVACQSLEDRINFYCKKGKLKKKIHCDAILFQDELEVPCCSRSEVEK